MTNDEILHDRRDRLIRQLWLALDRISREDEISDEDLDLFGAITKHQTIQKAVQSALVGDD